MDAAAPLKCRSTWPLPGMAAGHVQCRFKHEALE